MEGGPGPRPGAGNAATSRAGSSRCTAAWQLVRALHDAGLVDVYRLLEVFLVVLGDGKRLFEPGTTPFGISALIPEPTAGGVAAGTGARAARGRGHVRGGGRPRDPPPSVGRSTGLWGADPAAAADRAPRTPEVNARRALTLAGLSDRCWQISFGPGPQPAPLPEGGRRVLAVEPSDLAWRLAQPRWRPIRRRSGWWAWTARLPVPDASVDGVVSIFTPCTIPNVAAALVEIRRGSGPVAGCTSSSTGRRPMSPYAAGSAGCSR